MTGGTLLNRLLFFFIFTAWLALLAPPAHALRIVHFNATGFNEIRRSANVTSQSSCVITIVNRGAASQTYTLAIFGNATGSGGGPSGGWAADATNPASLSGTLTAGSSVTYRYTYAPFVAAIYPATPANSIGSQVVTCYGSIQVNSTTPANGDDGTVSASGVLYTFVQTTQGFNDTYGVSKWVEGAVTQTQVPIMIGSGTPF